MRVSKQQEPRWWKKARAEWLIEEGQRHSECPFSGSLHPGGRLTDGAEHGSKVQAFISPAKTAQPLWNAFTRNLHATSDLPRNHCLKWNTYKRTKLKQTVISPLTTFLCCQPQGLFKWYFSHTHLALKTLRRKQSQEKLTHNDWMISNHGGETSRLAS